MDRCPWRKKIDHGAFNGRRHQLPAFGFAADEVDPIQRSRADKPNVTMELLNFRALLSIQPLHPLGFHSIRSSDLTPHGGEFQEGPLSVPEHDVKCRA
jgi:hypothetical protein